MKGFDTSYIKAEYEACVSLLERAGILPAMSCGSAPGVTGADGISYPVPAFEKVADIFRNSRKLANEKKEQGFVRLLLTPLAMPICSLAEILRVKLLERVKAGSIYRSRRLSSDAQFPVKVNADKQVWIWDTLKQLADEDKIVYFPREYISDHRGQRKTEVLCDSSICAVPGWSVGLAEDMAMIPVHGTGKTLRGRKQPETGASPREYLLMLREDEYSGETGKTIEDFIIMFLTRLDTAGEISNDRLDGNALWLIGQYAEYSAKVKSDLVPTGWWHREFGRLRLDAHRPGNKLCTKNWGVSTIVRLPGI